MIKTQAAIANGKGSFSIEEIEVFPPQGDEVLVKIKASGLCHTDYDSMSWNLPLIMGHEGAGIIEAIGAKVSSAKVGDRVILNWAIPCGHCFQCLEGNQSICEINSPVTVGNGINAGHAGINRTRYKGAGIFRSFNLGTLSGYTLVREAAIVKMEHQIPFSSASLIGCGVMTGYGSVVNAAKVKPGSSVVVLGSGGVGLNVIQAARIAGATKIIAIDIKDERLNMALQFGATHILKPEASDSLLNQAAEKVKAMTNGRGADYAFECTAIPALGAAPLAMIRNAGIAVQVSGIEEEISIDMNLFEWDKTYINPLYGKCRPQIDFPILLDLYKKGDLFLDELVTRTYSLQNLSNALEDMLNGKNAKGVIVF